MELRDYQKECVCVIDGMDKGSGLVSMATGLGKTVVFSHIKRKGRVLVLSHRDELVRQPIKYYDCKCGIEKAEETSHGEEVVLASVQSLIRRLDKFSPYDFDTIITDEAHHAAAESYKRIYSYFKPRLHIGFTATPNRGDKIRLDDVFEKIIFERNLKWGIKQGFLTDVNCLRVKVSYSLANVKKRMGDFVPTDLDKAINTEPANVQVAEIYKKYARGQTIIFTASVSHAENISKLIPCSAVVSGKSGDRSEIIKKYLDKEIKCLVNCMVFTEGTDLPLIETVIIARPTKNPSLYAQMVGRGLRKAEGKNFLTLIDCVGVSDIDICTAPSLMGIDADEVPPYKRGQIEGMLTDMESTVDSLVDCPENWVLNVKRVKLFAEQNGVDTHFVNWTKKPNGDFVCQLACGDRVGIKAVDEVGKTSLMIYAFDEEAEDFKMEIVGDLSLNEAFERAYYYIDAHYPDEKSLWNLAEGYAWSNRPASEKQMNLVKAKITKEEFERVAPLGILTRGDANQIINALSLKNLNKKALLRMHYEAEERKRQKKEDIERRQSLKIRKVLNRLGKKYYALILPDDLVVTDDWSYALEQIAPYEKDGKRVRYKSFLSLAEAYDFLRG